MLKRFPGPVPLATTERAFDDLAPLDATFAAMTNWVRHDAPFYRCFIAEADDALTASVAGQLRDRVGSTLGLDLAGPVRITAQRMDVGDGADRHTDRPLVGYEAARFIVQLDTPLGGDFRMLELAAEGWRPWLERPAVRNQGVAFELCEASHHDVTPCRTPRRTLVVHFWHRANPPHARELVHRWLDPTSFADLPDALDPLIAEADVELDDHVTGFAARVVWLLSQWGEDDLRGAFERTAWDAPPATDAEARARFVTHLALESFDRTAFEALSPANRRWWLAALDRE